MKIRRIDMVSKDQVEENNKVSEIHNVSGESLAHFKSDGFINAQDIDAKNSNLHIYWSSVLSRAIVKKDYYTILIASQFLLCLFPDDKKIICNRQAALIALGRAGNLSKEFDDLKDEILKDDDLTINYFDYLFHEKRFRELFYHIFCCLSQDGLERAKEYMISATEIIQHIKCAEMCDAEASLSCRSELPLYERIILSFTQDYKTPFQSEINVRKSTLYLQVDVLLRMIATGYRATGIQRAICEIINELPKTDEVRVFFFRPEMNYPVSICSLDFLEILNGDSGQNIAWSLLFEPVSVIHLCESNGFIPFPNDKVVLLDAFWACPIGRLAAFLDECQCEIYMMIYDLIPLTTPGEPADDNAFKVGLEVLETYVDRFLAISDYTRTMVERYLSQKEISKKCISVPLAQQKPSRFEVFLGNNRSSLADQFLIEDLLNKPFILSVSSVSARKRILETAEAFQDTFHLCPEWHLVIVGQDPGNDHTLTDALVDVCKRSEGRIIWLKNVGDGDLDRLYQHCAFVTYLSRNEGWGLPIGEALAYGKLPLAHHESSIPEVGSSFAVYCGVDRQSVASALLQIMQDEPIRKRMAKTDLQNSLRTWRDVADDFLQAVNFEV